MRPLGKLAQVGFLAILPLLSCTGRDAGDVAPQVHPPPTTCPQVTCDGASASSPLKAHNNLLGTGLIFRVACKKPESWGSGFAHRSGKILTSAHVVGGCAAKDLLIFDSSNRALQVSDVISDEKSDLSLISLVTSLDKGLRIRRTSQYQIGAMVFSWGYPSGYIGLEPLLTVGHIAGSSPVESESGLVQRLFVNAAFNPGNSGGPLLDTQDGEVIAVVAAKHSPISTEIRQSLAALQQQRSGITYERVYSDGRRELLLEGQVVAGVLDYLRKQTQLVIGLAVPADQIVRFLEAQKLEP
jgi:S1-C subfamily serine protease